MNASLRLLLELADGPLFRFAFALLVLGLLRALLLGIWNALAAYLILTDRAAFWHKITTRVTWFMLPSLLLGQLPGGPRGRAAAYHLGLDGMSLVFRTTALVVPAFMVEHVYLWQRHLGWSWHNMSPSLADTLTLVVIGSGLIVFLGRLYSPWLRRYEAPWSFIKPLIIVLPFASGMLAMHPTFSPVDYHVVRLVHAVSASLVFVLIPFGRLLSPMNAPLTAIMPDARWPRPADSPTGPTPAPAAGR